MSRFDKACAYAMSGGIPLYAVLFSGRRSLKENVIAHFLSPSGFLFEEPENLLKQELREPASCNALIREIASGTTRLGELASKTGFDTARVSHMLKTLMDLGIVIKESPAEISLKTGRKAIYRIGDGLYQFWYCFIPPLIELVQRNRGEEAWKIIESGLSTYMGRIFEEICKQFLWRENAADPRPFVFQSIGRWWGNDPLRKEEAEIDLVAFQGKESALFCECKWKNEKTGTDVLNALIAKSAQFNYAKKYYRIFSKSGFAASCVKAAKEAGNVQLTIFDEMC
ncbi:ATP-binding protein [Leadbettera azotonutricia]|uniref:ATP-binding protein n=1 Tax=Leadbettera azotonutricia TaxID=150829 RepID=UPI003CCB1951